MYINQLLPACMLYQIKYNLWYLHVTDEFTFDLVRPEIWFKIWIKFILEWWFCWGLIFWFIRINLIVDRLEVFLITLGITLWLDRIEFQSFYWRVGNVA
ncbi:hypothetical protein [Pseudomonas phage Astolliot]|nr:hypothetical protein [Pseudomonas phage Astolliot]